MNHEILKAVIRIKRRLRADADFQAWKRTYERQRMRLSYAAKQCPLCGRL